MKIITYCLLFTFILYTYEAIINDTTRRWPNAEGKNYPEIDYYIDWWADYSEVRAAFRELAHYTCIKFNRVWHKIVGNNKGINVLYYTKSCRTEYSGMNPNGPNVIYIGDNCYGSNVFVQSLIMQVLGLEAEHNRRDRDNYVKIYPENLQPHFAKFFKKDRINTTVTYNIQYDYGSVIHGSQFIYTDRYYVKSIKALGEHDVYYQRMIGQRKGISFTEFKLINYHYCNNSCSQNITCYWNGYQSPNRCHECECPFPFFGNACVSIRPSEKIICPATRLTALDKEQKIEYWGWRQCYNLITANNSDATVHIRITYIYFDDFKFCSRGGHNFLEVKYRADRGVMGVCFCYKLFDFEHNIYTEDRHAVLIYHGYYQTARAYLFYNQHIPSPLDRPKE